MFTHLSIGLTPELSNRRVGQGNVLPARQATVKGRYPGEIVAGWRVLGKRKTGPADLAEHVRRAVRCLDPATSERGTMRLQVADLKGRIARLDRLACALAREVELRPVPAWVVKGP
jgi:hypothetical protein